MSSNSPPKPTTTSSWFSRVAGWSTEIFRHGKASTGTISVVLAGVVGVLAGFGAALFSWIIDYVTTQSIGRAIVSAADSWTGLVTLIVLPAFGLLVVSWFTRRFAPEAQGHGVPEVITAVARHDGIVRPQVALVKILASGFCIGTGGSVGREGPIVQIGSSLGSTAGQLFKLSPRNVKVLVAAGAAAGISATFHAPLAGVMFASEIILGSFAVESLTPIVIASVLADVVQQHIGEHRLEPAFRQLQYDFAGAWQQLPSYILLGLLTGLAAAAFIQLLYRTEDVTAKYLPKWWHRAAVLGLVVGIGGVVYPVSPPVLSEATQQDVKNHSTQIPPLLGVGYGVVDHALHIDTIHRGRLTNSDAADSSPDNESNEAAMTVDVEGTQLLAELWWLLPLVLLKPLATSLTLAGGGSGGVFAPSLYLGATLGACFGLVVNIVFPEYSNTAGVYAIVGMGAAVAGTTHGVLSAILIVYEMTNNYQIILPIMAAAGVASLISRAIEPESIYYKKLSRRGGSIARGHDLHRLDHVMVRDVMIRNFPTLKVADNAHEIIRVARANPHIESLPVMDGEGKLLGIIRPTDLHRVLDSDISPHLVHAADIALTTPISVSPAENLIEALRDFGTLDVETLPVEVGVGTQRRLVGLLLRSHVMRRYRQEILAKH